MRKFCVVLAVCSIMAGCAAGLIGGDILFITSNDSSYRWTREAAAGFREYFRKENHPVGIEVMELGVARLPGLKPLPRDTEVFLALLKRKQFDVIVTTENAATDLVLKHYRFLPEKTSVVFCGYAGFDRIPHTDYPKLTGIKFARNFLPTLELALELFPQTQTIAVLTGGSATGKARLRGFQRAAVRFKKADLHFLHGDTMSTLEMLNRLAQLPPEAVVVLDQWRSALPEPFSPYPDLVKEITRVARRPVFTLFDTPPGDGPLGGILMSGTEYGAQAAQMAARILDGESAINIPVKNGISSPVFDWSFLSRWEQSSDLLPDNTVFIGRPLPFWMNRQREAAFAAGILLLLLLCFAIWDVQKRRHRNRLNGLFAALPIHVGVTDARNNLLFFQAGKVFSADLHLTRLSELPVELLREITEPIRRVFETGENFSREYSVFGRYQQLDFMLLPKMIFGKSAVMWIATDVSKLHAAYTERTELADRFRLILESIGDAVIVTDSEGGISLMNPAACRLTGLDNKQAAGKKVTEVFRITPDAESPGDGSPVAEVLYTGRPAAVGHVMLRLEDGKQRHISANVAPIRDKDGLISGAVIFFHDETDEYEKRDMLNTQNVILRTATEVADIAYFRGDRDGRMYPLGGFEKHWGCLDGKPLPAEEWIAPEDLSGYLKEREELLSGKVDYISHFYRSKPAAGGRFFEMRVVRTKAGASDFYGIIQDITDRRENERRMKDNAALLKSILDNLPGYVSVRNANDEFRYILCNRAFASLTGRESSDIIGRKEAELFPAAEQAEGDRADDLSLLRDHRLLDSEEHVQDTQGGMHVLRTLKSLVPRTDGANLLLSISIDITRQSQLEQERLTLIAKQQNLLQSERTINLCLTKISVENNFGRAVNEMLQVIGENMGADRCYIFRISDGAGDTAANVYEWVAGGVEPLLFKQRKVALPAALADRLTGKNDFIIEDADLVHPDGLPQVFMPGVKSALISGIWSDGRLWGFIGLDFKRCYRRFSDSDIHIIHGGSKLFLLARERRRQMDAVADSVSLQRQIVDNISIPIAIFDPEGRIVSANRSLCDICGIPPDEICGRMCHEVICEQETPPPWCPMQKTRSELCSQSVTEDIHGRRLILTTLPLFDRNHTLRNILHFAMDITELTAQQSQLQAAMEAAQAADRAKSEFLATMSHELRTPLNAVIGFSELLQAENVPRAETDANLQAINLAGHKLLDLINDVIDLSQMETDDLTLTPEPVNLKELFAETFAIFRQRAENRNLALEQVLPDRLPRVVLDLKRFRQILLNLIGSVIKSARDGSVTLTAGFEMTDEAAKKGCLSLRLAVPDSAVSREDGGAFFAPFREHAVRGNHVYEGTGLELALVQRLCNVMGGSVQVSCEDGQGVFLLSFGDVACLTSELPPEEPAVLRNHCTVGEHVLLIDDVPLNLKVMGAMFARLRIPYICCSSAREAIAEIEKSLPTAVFTDLWMPEMGGDELAQYLRRNPATASIPIVVVTADTLMDRNVQRHFDGVLLKPLTLDALQRCLAAILPNSKEAG